MRKYSLLLAILILAPICLLGQSRMDIKSLDSLVERRYYPPFLDSAQLLDPKVSKAYVPLQPTLSFNPDKSFYTVCYCFAFTALKGNWSYLEDSTILISLKSSRHLHRAGKKYVRNVIQGVQEISSSDSTKSIRFILEYPTHRLVIMDTLMVDSQTLVPNNLGYYNFESIKSIPRKIYWQTDSVDHVISDDLFLLDDVDGKMDAIIPIETDSVKYEFILKPLRLEGSYGAYHLKSGKLVAIYEHVKTSRQRFRNYIMNRGPFDSEEWESRMRFPIGISPNAALQIRSTYWEKNDPLKKVDSVAKESSRFPLKSRLEFKKNGEFSTVTTACGGGSDYDGEWWVTKDSIVAFTFKVSPHMCATNFTDRYPCEPIQYIVQDSFNTSNKSVRFITKTPNEEVILEDTLLIGDQKFLPDENGFYELDSVAIHYYIFVINGSDTSIISDSYNLLNQTSGKLNAYMLKDKDSTVYKYYLKAREPLGSYGVHHLYSGKLVAIYETKELYNKRFSAYQQSRSRQDR